MLLLALQLSHLQQYGCDVGKSSLIPCFTHSAMSLQRHNTLHGTNCSKTLSLACNRVPTAGKLSLAAELASLLPDHYLRVVCMLHAHIAIQV